VILFFSILPRMETEIQEAYYMVSIKTLFTIIKRVFNFMYYSVSIYLLWILIHFCASHLYIYYCVPLTVSGFLVSPFLVSAPHCKALNWAIYNGSNIISYMWIIIGTWVCSKIFINFGRQ
jgi:hypothetical protein